ncbi:hypothetical protein EON68_00715 [archaeon]|nr:MAG: hypothetical protein EON68_00715 [archaeon]
MPTPTMSVGSEAVAASLTPEVRSASEAAPSFGVASSRTKTLRELMRFVDGSVGRATSPRRQDSVSVVGADAGGYGGAGVAKETITQEALRKAASAEAAAQAAAVPMAGTRVERPMGRATSPRILPARSPYADLTAAEAAAISAAAPRRPTSCRPTAVQLGDATAYPADATFKTMAQRVFAEHQSPLDAPRLAALAANKQRTQSAAASALLAPEYTYVRTHTHTCTHLPIRPSTCVGSSSQ